MVDIRQAKMTTETVDNDIAAHNLGILVPYLYQGEAKEGKEYDEHDDDRGSSKTCS